MGSTNPTRAEPTALVTVAGETDRRRTAAIGAAICGSLVAIVWIVFGQTLHHEFIDYDDGDYVYENPQITRGLSLSGIGWAFTHIHAQNWHPVTSISHMMDCQLYGLQPWGHHLTNVWLHAAAVILLFLALLNLTDDTGRRKEAAGFGGADRDQRSWLQSNTVWPSAFVAALFAIHPLRVESVAWVAERKDVLSGVFFMLTLLAYARYARSKHFSIGRYFAVLILFALGLMSKPTLVTLPFVLLLLDYWPLGRWHQAGVKQEIAGRGLAFPDLLIEKIPFFVLAAGSSLVTFFAQLESVAAIQGLHPQARIVNAIVCYVIYLGQTVYPARLAVLYPYPQKSPALGAIILALLLLVGISAIFWRLRKRHPFLLVGWFWFLGMLVPMIGFVQVGSQSHADRYTYLPQIGLFVLVVWGVTEFARRRLGTFLASTATGLLVVTVLAMRSYSQARYWQNGETLWRHTIGVTTANYIAHNDLANWLLQKGRFDEAIAESQQSLAIAPTFPEAHITLGNTFFRTGRLDSAAAEYRAALGLRPDFADVRVNLGNALLQQGDVDQAIAQYEKALEIRPAFAQLHSNLGNALLRKGDVSGSIDHYEKALSIDPDFAEVHNNLGYALSRQGRFDDAVSQYNRALAIKPAYAEAEYNLGNAYLQQHQNSEAIVHYRKALAIKPDQADAEYNLAKAFAAGGNYPDAIAACRAAVRLRPDFTQAHNNLGCFLSAIGASDEAIDQFNQALRIDPNCVEAHYNLGHLLAQLGRRDQAAAHLSQVLRLDADYADTRQLLRELGVGGSE